MLKNECSRNCWLAAAVIGLLVWIFNGTFFGGLILGLIAFFLIGNLLVWLVCEGRGGLAEDSEVLGSAAMAAPPVVDDSVLGRAERAVVDAGNAFAAGTVAAVAKGREAIHDMREEMQKRDDDDDDRDDDDRDDRDRDDDRDDRRDDDDSIVERAEDQLERAGEAVKDAFSAIAARSREAFNSLSGKDGAKGGAEAATAKEAAPADKPVPPAAEASPVEPTTEPSAAKQMPASAPAQGGSDNLKEIKGVGPALESVLHENGVTSFAQIAAWTDSDIDHFAEVIGRMGGRIRSDDWVSQAKTLAEGGETEFSRRVDDGEVY